MVELEHIGGSNHSEVLAEDHGCKARRSEGLNDTNKLEEGERDLKITFWAVIVVVAVPVLVMYTSKSSPPSTCC